MSDAKASPVQFNATTPVEERRQSPRSKMSKIVYMNMEAENGGILLDISLSGLSFQLAGPLAKEDQISFRLSAEGIEDVVISADVAWLDEHRKRGGLRFGQLPKEVGELIPIWFRQTPAPITGALHRAPATAAKPISLTQLSKPAPLLVSEMISSSLTDEPSQVGLARLSGSESNLGGLAIPLRSARNLRQLDSAHQLQFTAKQEGHFGAIVLAIFVSMIVAAGAFVLANKRAAGELLIHLGERVSGDYSRQSTYVATAPSPSISSVTSSESTDSAGDAPQAGPAQTASKSNGADSAVETGTARDEDRPEERWKSGLIDDEATAPSITDQSSTTDTSSSPSLSESATATGQSRRSGSIESPREDGGHTEVVLAQQYLRGSNVPKDRDMAAHLLWVAVGEGNPQAELELADLYLRDDGVPAKNCAQARILLNDSSNSGNVEATEQLAKLSDFGCR